MIPEPASWSLLTATAALMAFLIGLYTLVGRDRKSPYLINSVFKVFVICLVGAAFDILATIFMPWRWGLAFIGACCLFIAIVLTCWRVWAIYVRLAKFVDPGWAGRVKLLPGVRQLREWLKRPSGPTYEHNPVLLAEEVQAQIRDVLAGYNDDTSVPSLEFREHSDPRSLALSLRHHGQANELLSRLVAIFLIQDRYTVQYMTASRHPIEFVDHLRKAWPTIGVKADGTKVQWEAARSGLVVVDGYTPHFGFTDSINKAKNGAVVDQIGSRLISSAETYAGMHSASAAAFKLIKRDAAQPGVRQPTLVIYEDMFALADLESVEQYRVFVRHVLPSERLWDSMFTVFAETAQPATEWKLLSSYADITLDLSEKQQDRAKDGAKQAEVKR
ncbi:hypothetical protein [Sphingobium yanoikuyae]